MKYETTVKGLELFDATIENVIDILGLIKEIAIYEKMLNEVTATEESLRVSLFEKKRALSLIHI